MTKEWNDYFFKIAEVVASKSKDPSTKVGAVLVNKDKQIIACGYNGFPADYPDAEVECCTKEYKYARTIHAEMNAILCAAKNGITTKDSIIYVTPLQICDQCAKNLIQAGVKEIHCRVSKTAGTNWDNSFMIARDICKKCNVELYLEQTDI